MPWRCSQSRTHSMSPRFDSLLVVSNAIRRWIMSQVSGLIGSGVARFMREIVQMARGPAFGADHAQPRYFDLTPRHRVWTTRMEMTSRRRRERRRDLAVHGGKALPPDVDPRHFSEQGLCIRMVRPGVHLLGRS